MGDPLRVVAQLVEHQGVGLDTHAPVDHQDDDFEIIERHGAARQNHGAVDHDFALAEAERALVEQPAGAFFMFSRFSWSAVGGFAENYFPVWFEDVDFCLKAKGKGFKLYADCSVKCEHIGTHIFKV